MTDRDRLITIILEAIDITAIADHLLANGVILPPCKVGDKVYTVGVFTGQVIPTVVIGIDYTANDMFLHLDNSTFVSVVHQLGKTVFLTKEEAENKLKEMEREG